MNALPASDLQGVVSRLFIHPVKSCAAIEVREAVLTGTGLAWDRAWMVVDARGEFLSQRSLPRMALVRPQLPGDGLVLHAPGMPALRVPLEPGGTPFALLRARVWSDVVDAWDMGDAAARWFSGFLGQPCRLVRFDPGYRRLCSLRWTGGIEAHTQFADGYPLLVTSAAAIDDLNGRLRAAGCGPVGMERFRPNLVIGGVEAHDEDHVDALTIDADGAAVELRMVKPCARCPIPDIDPATAESAPHVGDALRAYRQDARLDGAITFGMNAIATQGVGRTLRVGQAVAADLRFG
ncbi:MOSC domain-containing protein [Alicycliphilus denitrificans]|uniref:MOSC domain-containing protein n=1 Tax=Alicycliphilus denitrificans TaxID=179636 RepID=A0A3R7LFE8_9BURK|nr:MOSC N-terminal beta barrel domain-containing protein [Alicycliphilus denitrificans]RKJ96704.1 MOSC domain-containing protein [Alicycliphilus denitrificans]